VRKVIGFCLFGNDYTGKYGAEAVCNVEIPYKSVNSFNPSVKHFIGEVFDRYNIGKPRNFIFF
jgi:hypothetical protein